MKKLLLLLLALPLLYSSPLHAVSYPPSVQEPTYLKETEVIQVGGMVHLFHSGTKDVTASIRIGDVLTVYHEYPPDIWTVTKQTGKVKVISTIGDYYFEGKVVEGYVQPGSLAMKGGVACIITTRLKPKE
jgi:hypothetical protein